MKNKKSLVILLVKCISLAISLLFYGCASPDNKEPYHVERTYELWTQLHNSPSLAVAEAFFENIEKYSFDFVDFYPDLKEQTNKDKDLMDQNKQALLELLRNYQITTTPPPSQF